jgi:predicted DsbA family dithiol-disulfide isomerase
VVGFPGGVVRFILAHLPLRLFFALGGSGGVEDLTPRLMREYHTTQAQVEANHATVRSRAAAVGFAYNTGPGSRAWNTFDAHRLSYWAEVRHRSKAVALKEALFRAYFTTQEDVSDREVLVRIAASVGLDADTARHVLESNQFASEVRAQELRYQQAGIRSVPATIINNTWLISGGQPPEAFESALRDVLAKSAAATPTSTRG